MRRAEYLAARDAEVADDQIVAWLAERGKRTIYTPETSIASSPAPLLGPHLREAKRAGRSRAAVARRTRGRSVTVGTALSVGPAAAALVGGAMLLFADGGARMVGAALVLVYIGALVVSGALAALHFRSIAVGLLEPPAVVATQAAYLWGFGRGLIEKTGKPIASESVRDG